MKPYYLLIPYFYGFNTRAKTTVHRISFLLFIFAPIFIAAYFMTCGEIDILLFILSFSAMYVVYEIGYIYNDVYTTKKEKKPTRWLKTENQEAFTQDFFPFLISVRVVYAAILIVAINHLGGLNSEAFIICLALLDFSFSGHNYFRNKVNIITDFAVNIFKYSIPLIPFVTSINQFPYILWIIVEIPLARGSEFIIGHKYGLKHLQQIQTDIRRIIFYGILLLIGMAISFFTKEVFYLILSGYLFTYRFLCYFATKIAFIKKMRVDNGDRKNG